MKVPSVSWLPRSRMKFEIRRGPKLPLANETATIVIENTVPATPMIEPPTVTSTARAPSVCVWLSQPKRPSGSSTW